MAEHAQYAPSKLERIIKCPGSIALENALFSSEVLVPGLPSVYAQHGTMLHDYTHRARDVDDPVLKELETDDRILVNDALEYLKILITSFGHEHFTLAEEQRVSMKAWGFKDIWGTADIQLINLKESHAHIIDWKFGSGVVVYAPMNPQLLAYAAGSIAPDDEIKKITLHVFQPAVDHVSTFTLTLQELFNWVYGTLAPAIGKARYAEPVFIPGEEQCRWCPCKNHCDMRFVYVQEQATKLFAGAALLPKKITPEAIIELVKTAPLVEQAIKDLKLYMMNEIQRGADYPGYKLVHGRSNRTWVDEKKATAWMAEHTGIEELFKSKLISPSQAEKLVKTLKTNADFQALFHKPEGKPTLVSDKDPRPAIPSQSVAVDVFAEYKVPDKLE